MNYGSFSNGQAYRSHLDSRDFMNFLRWTVAIALVLSAAFSIRGNFAGLSTFLSGGMFFSIVVSAGITLTSSVLSMLAVIKIEGLTRSGRVFIGIGAAVLLISSILLTLVGFGDGEQQIKAVSNLNHPEILNLNMELKNIIQRQKEHGLKDHETRSLLAREKELRNRIFETQDRLNKEQKSETSLEQAIGSDAKLARLIFASAPDLAIGILSPIICLLFGMVGAGAMQTGGQGPAPERQVVYLPMQQGQGQNQGQRPAVANYQMPADRQPAQAQSQQRQPVEMNQGGGNGHVNQGPAQSQMSFGWDPFQGQ